MMIQTVPFGQDAKGRPVCLIQVSLGRGQRLWLSNLGASLVRFDVPAKDGRPVNVVLGYDDALGYLTGSAYLGATVGRVANRIGGASFKVNGAEVQVTANETPHCLHGGREGLHRRAWAFKAEEAEGLFRVIFNCLSPDMEDGFTGNLAVTVTYEWTSDSALSILYEAISDKDGPVSFTNHSYFNLSGVPDAPQAPGTIHGHRLSVNADRYLLVAPDMIATGDINEVAGTPYDLRQPQVLGDVLAKEDESPMLKIAKGLDVAYVLPIRDSEPAASLFSPDTGLKMDVFTDQPSLQVYTGQYLHVAGGSRAFPAFAGVALETQGYPNAVNLPHFPSILLKAGETYRSKTVYRVTFT